MEYQTVNLISVTKPTIPGINTTEEFIAYAARVSNPANQNNTLTSSKLLKYLLKHGHWSPFEMAHIVLEINTTRDIARQILRHRSFSFQEFSQRYADPRELGFVTREARLQDTKNRQNSLETDDKELQDEWNSLQLDLINRVKKVYNFAITNGIAKEQARAPLPEGNTMSRLYMAGSIRSWIHFLKVRLDISTQKENRDIAQKAVKAISIEIPSIYEVIESINEDKR